MDLKLWIHAFDEIAKYSNEKIVEFSNKLAVSNTMKRFFYRTFDTMKPFPSFEDFTVSIAMELLDKGSKISIEDIISYSDAVYDKWLENIILDDRSREYLIKIGKSPLEMRGNQKSYEELLILLKNRTELGKAFFKSYNTMCLDSYIKVYLPNENGIIDWKEERSINIMVNTFKGFELGFFRIGYDYKYFTGESLTIVTYSESEKYECAAFHGKKIGKITDKIIWAR